MLGQEPVDADKAVTVGSDSLTVGVGNNDFDLGNDADAEKEARTTALEMLHQLPGVNHNNARALMQVATSIADLATKTETELAPVLGHAGARKMIAFFRQRIFRES
jgi:ERCC4-type nuclease